VERESSLGLAIFPPVLRGVRAIMYNSFEEQTMIQALAGNAHVPGVVVGIGSEIPQRSDGERARRKFGLRNRFIVYVGRIDVNKGCAELFELFTWYLKVSHLALRDQEIDLVLIGAAMLKIPDHPHIRHLGYVSDDDKFDVIAAAELLVMPSFYESLSMVALEAWALGKPVLVNARCDVLLGQALRSNAGLYYETASDFAGALDALLDRTSLASAMGENGRRYYSQHYDWSVIEQKYLEMFRRLAADPPRHAMEPLPGSRERRRRDKPPASEVVVALPRGAVRRPTADEVSST
jgi:glycosyltransferase involved in cell wall biosynthesis